MTFFKTALYIIGPFYLHKPHVLYNKKVIKVGRDARKGQNLWLLMSITFLFSASYSTTFYPSKFVATTLDGCKQTRIYHNPTVVQHINMSPTKNVVTLEWKQNNRKYASLCVNNH